MDNITINKFINKIPLTIINNQKGNIYKIMNNKDSFFKKFGEVYFTSIKKNSVKAWRFHKRMTINLVVPIGKVKFVFYIPKYDYYYVTEIGQNNYCLLNVKPKIWFAFKGLDKSPNLILNFSNIIHNDNEILKKDLKEFNYSWN